MLKCANGLFFVTSITNVKLRSYMHSNMRGSMLFIRMFDRVNGVIAPNMRDQHAEPFSVSGLTFMGGANLSTNV